MEYENKIFDQVSMEEVEVKGTVFMDCTFQNCSFTELKLKDCQWKDCTFKGCTLINNQFLDVTMSGCEFQESILIGVNWSELMRREQIFLPFTCLKGNKLKYNVFYSLGLKKIDFTGCDLEGSFFDQCNLELSKFNGCNLKETIFTDNNLKASDFRRAQHYHIPLDTNILKGAKFSLPEVLNLLSGLGILVEE